MLEIIKGLVGAFGGAFVFLYLSEYWKPLREIYTDKLTDDGKQIFAELRAKKPDSSESEIEDSIPSFCPSSVLGESVTLSSLKTIPKDKALYVGAILAVGIANPHLAPFVLIFATIAYYDLKNATAPWELSVVGVLFALSAFWQDYGIMFPNGMFNYSEMLYSLAFPASVWLGCFLIAIFFGSVFIGLLDLEAFVIASLFLRTPTLIIVSFLAFTFLKIIIVRFAPSVVSKKLAEYGMT